MTYAIISLGGKQYRVREGERLLVNRLPYDEGKTFHPEILVLGGDGETRMGDALKGEQVTATVARHVLGEKIVIGKHRRRTGYWRRNGHRSRLSQVEIQTIGKKATRPAAEKKEPAAKEAPAKKPRARKTTTRKSKEKE